MSNILQFTIKRLLATIVVAWVIVTIVFVLGKLSPYDPIGLFLGRHKNSDPAVYHRLLHLFGYDQSGWQQYLNYLGGLLHGNLGYSVGQDTLGQPIWPMLRNGVPQTLKLGSYALVLSLLVGLPVGFISALRQNSAIDHGSQVFMMVAYAIPSFVLAPVAQLVFGVLLHWLPVTGWGDPGSLGYKEMILPVTIYAAGLAGFFAKSFRSFLLEVMRQDYIRTARAKGLSERVVIYLHAFKNTLLPLASIVGPTIAFLIVGSFIIETFFTIPGIGLLTVESVLGNDLPVIEATTIILALFVIAVNFLTDIFYTMIDPRVRL